ncbi:putative adipose-regulatory protein-domain-containing protein [Xylaria venustula]|nr:putative adipose-regulatory protein-domain-containing protein [Xylaria venustula]
MQYIKAPYHAATSSTAKKTYLGTALFVSASFVLLGIAALIYPLFYYSYVPKKLVTVPVHLQYDAGANPYGIVSLSSDLMSEQTYDVSIDLVLPRSPANLDRGNFMVALYATKSAPTKPPINPALLTFAASSPLGLSSSAMSKDPYDYVSRDNVVFASRRPALIPYEDPLVSTASRVLFLLYHIVFSRAAETVALSIPMGELVVPARSGTLPLSVLVDVQAGPDLQVYSSSMTLVARLTGMRWFMYNHRVFAFAAFVTVFWVAEVVSMGFAWGVLRWALSSGQNTTTALSGSGFRSGSEGWRTPQQKYKDEEDDDDITVKTEDDDVEIKRETPESETMSGLAVGLGLDRPAADADDEGGSEDGWEVSGTGSGFHDGRSSAQTQVRRRSSRGRSA